MIFRRAWQNCQGRTNTFAGGTAALGKALGSQVQTKGKEKKNIGYEWAVTHPNDRAIRKSDKYGME